LPVFSSRRRSGLFHPDSARGVPALQGFVPLKKPRHLPMNASPSWRFFRTAAGCHGGTGRRRPRLAQLALATGPFFAFRVSSSPRVGAHRWPILRPTDRHFPLGLLPLYGFPLVQDETDFAASPLSRFDAPSFLRLPSGAQHVGAPAYAFHERGGIVSLETA
jgi:hypothetical protein